MISLNFSINLRAVFFDSLFGVDRFSLWQPQHFYTAEDRRSCQGTDTLFLYRRSSQLVTKVLSVPKRFRVSDSKFLEFRHLKYLYSLTPTIWHIGSSISGMSQTPITKAKACSWLRLLRAAKSATSLSKSSGSIMARPHPSFFYEYLFHGCCYWGEALRDSLMICQSTATGYSNVSIR